MQLKLGAGSTTIAQDLLIAELKRVGTQQEVLKKAVAEATAEAQAEDQSFSISPLPGFEPGKRDKGAGQIAAPDGPGIQAKWADSPSPSRQGSQDAAVSQTDSAAVQMAEAAEMNNRAESLHDRVDQISPPSQTVTVPQAAPPSTEANKRSTLPPELITQAGVADSRSALARMQIALGGHDDSGKAAFDPAQYTFDKLPSQNGMKEATFSHLFCTCIMRIRKLYAH